MVPLGMPLNEPSVDSGSQGGGDDASVDAGAPSDAGTVDAGLQADEVLYLQALSDYRSSQFSVARAEFEQLLMSWPDSPRAASSAVFVAQCDFHLGAFALCEQELTASLGAVPQVQVMDRALFWRGRARFAQRAFLSARGDFEQLLTTVPSSLLADNSTFYVGRCDLEMAPADLPGAIAAFRALFSGWPTTPLGSEARYWLGRAEFLSGDFAGATTDLDLQLSTYGAMNPFADQVGIVLGRVALGLANSSQAQLRLQQVLTDFPLSSHRDEATYWLGRALFAGLNYVGALSTFTSVVTQWPGSSLGDNASFWAGRSAFAQPDYAQAIVLLRQAELNYPTSSFRDLMIEYEGRSEFQLLQYVNAQADFDRQLTLYPAGQAAAAGHYWRGRTEYATLGFAAALLDFDSVIAWQTPSIWVDNAWSWKVRTLSAQNDCAGADTAYTQFKASQPASPLLVSTCAAFRPTPCAGTCP
jgi:TolA-binding protein